MPVQQVRTAAAEVAEKSAQEAGAPRAQITVINGVDPALSPCVNDAKVVTSEMRTNNTKLEIIWSNKCYAGWARVTRYDEKGSGNTMTVSIYPARASTSATRSAPDPLSPPCSRLCSGLLWPALLRTGQPWLPLTGPCLGRPSTPCVRIAHLAPFRCRMGPSARFEC